MPVGRVSAGNTQAGIWQTDAKWKNFSLTFFSFHFQIIFLLPLFKSLYFTDFSSIKNPLDDIN
jgi:hypothetical protein